jgi:hypothetical protein
MPVRPGRPILAVLAGAAALAAAAPATLATAAPAPLAAAAPAAAAPAPLAAPARLAAAAAAPVPVAGQDVSWPQCPAGRGGYGLPMPAAGAAFVIVGLTGGRGFTTNPCVAGQAWWAKTHGVRTAAYLVPTYPTRTQLRRWGAAGPARATSLEGRVYNVGWAQAGDAIGVLRRSGLRATAVWIDVEANRKRPWSPDTAANTALVRGVAAAIRRARLQPGLYTNSSSWTTYTDGARLGLPEWRTVGPRPRGQALAACGTASLNGGRVLLVQHWTNIADHDVLCRPLSSRAARARWFHAP